jgi:hypothetical protein
MDLLSLHGNALSLDNMIAVPVMSQTLMSQKCCIPRVRVMAWVPFMPLSGQVYHICHAKPGIIQQQLLYEWSGQGRATPLRFSCALTLHLPWCSVGARDGMQTMWHTYGRSELVFIPRASFAWVPRSAFPQCGPAFHPDFNTRTFYLHHL